MHEFRKVQNMWKDQESRLVNLELRLLDPGNSIIPSGSDGITEMLKLERNLQLIYTQNPSSHRYQTKCDLFNVTQLIGEGIKIILNFSYSSSITSLQCGLFTLYARRRKYELSSGYIIFNNLKQQFPFSFHHSFPLQILFYLLLLLLLAALGLCSCTWAFSSCSGGAWVSLAGGAWVSHCAGFSRCRAQTLGHMGFRSLLHVNSIVVAHQLSSSEACGFFPDQGN